jgi:hypothetical protein
MDISPELEEKLWGDDAILRYLEITKKLFEQGDRTALFGAIALCARFQAVIPGWAADAILEMESKLENGQFRDFNEAFGQDFEKQLTRRKNARLKRYVLQVLRLLQQHRLSGGSLNTEEAFQPIADQLGISRRDVETIYKREGKFIKNLPQGNSDNRVYGFGRAILAVPRRYGRKILRDETNE